MRWLPSLLCECDDFLTSATLMCFRFLFYAQLLSAAFASPLPCASFVRLFLYIFKCLPLMKCSQG